MNSSPPGEKQVRTAVPPETRVTRVDGAVVSIHVADVRIHPVTAGAGAPVLLGRAGVLDREPRRSSLKGCVSA